MKKLFFITALAVLSAGCQSFILSRGGDRNDERAAIAVAILRHEMKCCENEWSPDQTPTIYFASVVYDHDPAVVMNIDDYRDPHDKIVQHFRATVPPVKPLSMSSFATNGGWPKDRETGVNGALFFVSNISIVRSGEAVVHGGYSIGPLGSAGFVYRLEKRGGIWFVAQRNKNWVS